MNPASLDNIAAQFYATGVHYSAAIQPYALKLLVSLFLIEILVTWIQYSAEGQLDPTYYFGRSFRHLMTSGFIYLMITNGFQWDVPNNTELLAHWCNLDGTAGTQPAERIGYWRDDDQHAARHSAHHRLAK
jgi:hypothetical protein